MRYFILLLTFCSCAYADSISFGVGTFHNDPMGCGYRCNENNNLIAYEHKNIVLATFNNSYYRQTYLAAYKFKLISNVSLLAGASHGYDRRVYGAKPIKANTYRKEIMPFASLVFQANINDIKLYWLESVYMRAFSIGFDF